MNMNAYRSKVDMGWRKFLRPTNWCGALVGNSEPTMMHFGREFLRKSSIRYVNHSPSDSGKWRSTKWRNCSLTLGEFWGFSQNFYPQVSGESLSGLQKTAGFHWHLNMSLTKSTNRDEVSTKTMSFVRGNNKVTHTHTYMTHIYIGVRKPCRRCVYNMFTVDIHTHNVPRMFLSSIYGAWLSMF